MKEDLFELQKLYSLNGKKKTTPGPVTRALNKFKYKNPIANNFDRQKCLLIGASLNLGDAHIKWRLRSR